MRRKHAQHACRGFCQLPTPSSRHPQPLRKPYACACAVGYPSPCRRRLAASSPPTHVLPPQVHSHPLGRCMKELAVAALEVAAAMAAAAVAALRPRRARAGRGASFSPSLPLCTASLFVATHPAVVPCGPLTPGTCTSRGGLRTSSQTWSMWRALNLRRAGRLVGLVPCLLLLLTLRLPTGPPMAAAKSTAAAGAGRRQGRRAGVQRAPLGRRGSVGGTAGQRNAKA
mmetsp:Transcript_16222/g.48273  ORF Transcript_16222/g.48273 Transcript_16222/m.48273 type:complete len:227 (+) Transcript_16222:3394-4074(+)